MKRSLAFLFVVALLASSCGGNPSPLPSQAPASGTVQPEQPGNAALPQDSLLPWESLDANGNVDPSTARRSSAINGNSEFQRGVDAWQTAGSTTPSGQALRLDSGSAGSAERSSATYRFPLAGENPATLSTDINLRLRSDSTPSEFFISIANYGTGRWDWFGPFTDGRVRLPLSEAATGDYISRLGNAFVSVVAFSGSSFDIVGVALNQFDPANASAPPVPTGLNLSPVNGGLELTWNPVIASDLAGYRIYYSNASFINPHAAGVRQLPYLTGETRHLLSGISGNTFVAVSAVDLNGNEGGISALSSAAVLPGSAPGLQLLAGTSSGRTGEAISLTASGASSYDWDLDGDGEFEITADSSGSQFADTGKAGIIRPAVRGSDGGTAVALGAVSLIVAANLPPVARLSASPGAGVRWPGDPDFLSQLDASASSDEDPAGLQFAFDPLGSGSFGADQPADVADAQYSQPGSYMASVRVTDSAGLQAYAYAPLSLKLATDWDLNFLTFRDPPGNEFLGAVDCAIVDGHPAIVYQIWNGTDKFELNYLRATDPWGRNWNAPVLIDDSPGTAKSPSLQVINGRPAIAFGRAEEVCYIRCATATGDTKSEWSNPVVVVAKEPGELFPSTVSLADISGRPAIAIHADFTGDNDTYYVRASSGSGDLAADWQDPYFLIEQTSAGQFSTVQLLEVGGNPAYIVSSSNQLLYERATSPGGGSALDWAGSAFSLCDQGSTLEDNGMDLAVIDGNPAVCWADRSSTPYKLRYRRSGTSTGATVGDWAPSLVLYAGSGSEIAGEYCSLAEVNGRPAVSFQADWNGGTGLFFRRALDDSGSSWGQLQLGSDGLGDAPGYESSLVTHNGWAGIAHFDGLIAGNLLYFSSVNLDD
ncbi:MAG: fibronectin type III domain-containing protein [bacterium]